MGIVRSAAKAAILPLLLALLLLSPVAPPAVAQTVGDGPPLPRVQFVDRVGVDLRSGRRTGEDGTLTIGAAGSTVLQYSFGSEGAGGVPLWGYVYYHCGAYPCAAYEEYVLGTKTEWWKDYSSSPMLTDGSQYEITNGVRKVYDKEGRTWTFAPLPGPGFPNTRVAYLTTLRYPNGETLTYHYRTLPGAYRPAGPERPAISAITSSAGYQLQLEAVGGGIRATLFNRADRYCDPVATACPPSALAWPTASHPVDAGVGTANFSGLNVVTYGQPQEGAQFRTSSSGQPVREIHQTVTRGGGVTKTYTFRRPSDSGACAHRVVVHKLATADGTWSYAYNLLWDGAYDCTVGSATSTAPDGSSVTRTSTDVLVDELGRETKHSFLYVSWGSHSGSDKREVASITYPEGNKVTFSYDDLTGRRNLQSTTVTPKPGSTDSTLTWSWNYPAACTPGTAVTCNQPSYELDPKGNRIDYTYDPAHGGVLTKTLPADANGVRPQIRYAYQQFSASVLNASGQTVQEAPIWKLVSKSECRTQASCAGTADEVVTSYTYTPSLLVATETVRSGDSSAYATRTNIYDHVGNLIGVDGPLPGNADTTYHRYNAARQLVGTVQPDPDGNGPLPMPATRRTYDADGRETLVEAGTVTLPWDAQWAAFFSQTRTATAYDGAGRPTIIATAGTGATEAVTQMEYNVAARFSCTAVRMNKATFPSIGAGGALTSGLLPGSACAQGSAGNFGADRIERKNFDGAGQLLSLERGVGTALQQVYAGYTYSPNGKRTSITDANGNKASMSYDGQDRQVRWSFPSPTSAGSVSASDYEAYGYDSNGNRTSLRKRDGTTLTYQYDALNRVTQKSVPASVTGAAAYSVFYNYELGGAQRYARFGSPSGPGVTNDWDSLGRLVSSTSTMDGNRTLTHHYDAASNRTLVTGAFGYHAGYDYDLLNRVTAIREGGGGIAARLRYDATARRAGIDYGIGGATSSVVSYQYDAVSRLSSLSHELAGSGADQTLGFAHNPSSQVVTRTSANDAHASTSAYNVSRGYAVNGLNQYVTAGPANFTYDANGNLTSDGSTSFVYDGENRLVSASGAKTASLAYDPLGRLWQTSGGPAGATRFLYDGDALVYEYDAAGNALRGYTHGPGTDEPLIWYELPGGLARRFLHADHQGSIVALADQAGSAVAINAYDPWGIPNAANLGRFGYTGQAWIPELGMYHYKARIYSPTLGRFLQTDPIGYKDQMNLYAYVGNDPVSMMDPEGKSGVLTINANEAHSWVSYHRDGDERPNSYGLFDAGKGNGSAGIQTNTERDGKYPASASRQLWLGNAAEARFFRELERARQDDGWFGDGTWRITHNCTHFAQEMWTAATGETFSDSWGVEVPTDLMDKLQEMNGGELHSPKIIIFPYPLPDFRPAATSHGVR